MTGSGDCCGKLGSATPPCTSGSTCIITKTDPKFGNKQYKCGCSGSCCVPPAGITGEAVFTGAPVSDWTCLLDPVTQEVCMNSPTDPDLPGYSGIFSSGLTCPSPCGTSSLPEFSNLGIFLVVLFVVAMVFLFKKKKKLFF
jgi:hypothetical protein